MKILHVIPGVTHEQGGPPTVLAAITRQQAQAGHHVVVLTTDQGVRQGEHPVSLHSSVEIERLRVTGPNRFAYSNEFSSAVRSRLRECDVVHIHSVFNYPTHVAIREALILGIPVVHRTCGQLHRYSLSRSPVRKRIYLSLWGRMLRRACSAWHYTSENEARESWPCDASPRFILPNGIEPDDYAMSLSEARRSIRQMYPEIGDSPYVLYLGRLHAKKRLDLLTEAFLHGAPKDAKLIVAGPDEGRLWESLAGRFLRDRGAAQRVKHVGFVHGETKIALLTAATLFALPSEHENFGNAALEALAAGTPVLLSPHVDLAKTAGTEWIGETIPLDIDKWSDRIHHLLDRSEKTEAFSAKLKEWIHARYGWKQIVNQLIEHYGRLKRIPAKNVGMRYPDAIGRKTVSS